MNFRTGGSWLGGVWMAGLGYLATMGACGPVSSDVGELDAGKSDGGEGGARGECEPGETRRLNDDCTTCTCGEDGNWSCTMLACGCQDGEMRPAGDTCNTCTCESGRWECTGEECTDPACTPGDMRSDDCNSCVCTDFGDGATWACTANVCTECTDGETKMAGDGCNTCDCVMGQWACTDAACGCTNGEMKPAGDGCNDCTCINGQWGCTMVLCNGGMCEAGYGDCDGDPSNACETNLASSTENCGACGNLCNFAGALGACEEGECAVGECMAGYADCNGEVEDGCEAPVGPGGCEDRCEVASMITEPVPAGENCECPAGTACLRGSVADEDPTSEYCYPIPNGCQNGFASCSCMSDCFCPEPAAQTFCYDQMSTGGVFIINCAGYPAPGGM